jgi:hypothetical protein
MQEFADEYVAATASAEPSHFDWLIARGVAKEFLWRGAMRFGVAEIVGDQDGHYQPMRGGDVAYIMPARPLPDDFSDGDLGDLVAWLPRDPGRWWLRSGLAPIINPAAIERAVWLREPLAVSSTPLDWLRRCGAGVVILSRDANLRLWLGGVSTIHADCIELGEAIERRMRVPPVAPPRVLVPAVAA